MSTLDPNQTLEAQAVPTLGEKMNGLWPNLRLPRFRHDHPPVQNANHVYQDSLSPPDKLAIKITDMVRSVRFFLGILCWTVLWTGYYILPTEIPGLHWKSSDPFPAFVACLLISNVIQTLLSLGLCERVFKVFCIPFLGPLATLVVLNLESVNEVIKAVFVSQPPPTESRMINVSGAWSIAVPA